MARVIETTPIKTKRVVAQKVEVEHTGKTRKSKEIEPPAKTRKGKETVEVDPVKTTAAERRAARAATKDAETDSTSKKKPKEVEEVVEKKTRKSKEVEEVSPKFFNPMLNFDDNLDGIEKDYALSGSSLGSEEQRLSTGNLTINGIIGGGLIPGWYTMFGGEQSCKSTGASTFMTAALLSEVPVISYWDYEGSSSPEYIENIMEVAGITMPIEQVFGIRDPKTAKWVVPPRVRYYAEGIAEKFFDYLAKLERMLPDKMQMNEQWYYVYEGKTPDGKIHKANAKLCEGQFDKNYFRKTGKFRVPAKDGTLQAFVIVDSYPAMLPEKQDVDDPGSALAMQARMFSEQIKRVKGKLKSKRICVVGVNQLRKAPMVAYGNPEYEPCGESLKFYSDVRLRMQPRVLNSAPGVTEKGMIMEEKSVLGGVDKYRFIHIRAHKNKLSVPNMEGWVRLWIEDANGEARGFDPVWDTWRYLAETGQCVGKRNAIKITIPGKENKKILTWFDLKKLVLGDRKTIKEVAERIGMPVFDLRAWCKRDQDSGKGLEKLFATKRLGAKEDAEDDAKPLDDSDDEE